MVSRRPVLQGGRSRDARWYRVRCFRDARCYRVGGFATPGVTGWVVSRRPVLQGGWFPRRPVLQGGWFPRRPVLQGGWFRGAGFTGWLLLRRPVLQGGMFSRRPVLQGGMFRNARCYRVDVSATPGVTGWMVSRRPVLQGGWFRDARCYRVGYRVGGFATPGVTVSDDHFHCLTMPPLLGHLKTPNHNNLNLNPKLTKKPIIKPHLNNPYHGTTHNPIENPQPQHHRPAPL